MNEFHRPWMREDVEPPKCSVVTPGYFNGRYWDPWYEDEYAALEICNGNDQEPVCVYRGACLIYSLIRGERYGVWGGMLADQRQRLRKRDPSEWIWSPPPVRIRRSRKGGSD